MPAEVKNGFAKIFFTFRGNQKALFALYYFMPFRK
jgi:hypothetical protein